MSSRRQSQSHTIHETVCVLLACFAPLGFATAQEAPSQQAPSQEAPQPALEAVVVTGTRIRQSIDTTSPAPIAQINPDTLNQRGFTQAGEALNEMTANVPDTATTPTLSNGQALAGQDFPNLFGLGPARTLTLMNGQRMVSSSSGLGDEAVDTNIIPVGLLKRIDIIQGGGAAVYGSGAIAGVVNYVLDDHFQGAQADAKYSSANGYPVETVRLTAGTDFLNGRGNVAADYEFSDTGSLIDQDRPLEYRIPFTAPNPVPGAGTNGIPSSIYVDNYSFLETQNGLVYTSPSNITQAGVLQNSSGQGVQINSAGNIVPVNLGTPIAGAPYYSTGSNLDWAVRNEVALVPKIQRSVGNLIAHYDLTDDIKLSTEVLMARTQGVLPGADDSFSQYTPILSFSYPTLRALPFYNTNPYLSAATIAALSAAYPAFAAGQPLYLSKDATNWLPENGDVTQTSETTRGEIGLDGVFDEWGRNFYWSSSYSHGEVQSTTVGYEAISANLFNAAVPVRNSAGQIVCSANATTITAPGCVPINIFGTAPLSAAAQEYAFAPSGTGVGSGDGNVTNTQDDALLTLGGDLVALPGGESQFDVSYEYRNESSVFSPLAGDLLGEFYTGVPIEPEQGSYHTHEGAAELDLPLLGKNFTVPLVESLELNGSYRYVQNSLAGGDDVWASGLRWKTDGGFTFRATVSRNFRAPDIAQALSPSVVTIGSVTNPCSNTQIGLGPAPATRAANCLALFTANPTFGLGTLPAGVPNTPANRLANYTQVAVSETVTNTTGNPKLLNETSHNFSFGFVYQPTYIPGLTASVDHLSVHLSDALTLYSVSDFAATCFDAAPQPAAYCNTLSYNQNGEIVGGEQTTVNAGSLDYRGETFDVDYSFALSSLASRLPGSFNFGLQATHNALETSTVAGVTTIIEDTPALPTWVGKLDMHYVNGPLTLNYTLFYMPPVLLTANTNFYNAPDGLTHLASNMTHNISAEYRFGEHWQVRLGVNNITNRLASFPSTTYGSMIGREYFVSVTAKL